MKLVLISDTHCQLEKIKVPKGDVLIHAGDLTYRGNEREITEELDKLQKIGKNFDLTILVPGNHDWMAEKNPALIKQLCQMYNIAYIHDDYVQYNGQKIYGSGWQPEFCNWALNLPRGPKIKEKWDLIPDDTTILVTHGPMYETLDLCPDGRQVGCVDLKNTIEIRLKSLKLHIFGHIHHSYGSVTHKSGLISVNASICTEAYNPYNKPIVIEI